ncbi:MAG: RNA polymerase sigma factor [Gemmataceae bacterium]
MDEVARRLAGGDAAAFAELYDACADRLHHYLAVRLGSRHDADDVLQETFLRVARNARRLAAVENLTAYVFQIARNEAARFVGTRPRREELSADDLFEIAADDESREAADTVATGLARLNGDQREVVELKHFAGLTFREIGEVTGVPTQTAATRYRAALDRLRDWLARQPT